MTMTTAERELLQEFMADPHEFNPTNVLVVLASLALKEDAIRTAQKPVDFSGHSHSQQLRREQARVNRDASGTEARERQDPVEGLDPKGDGPTGEAEDAQ